MSAIGDVATRTLLAFSLCWLPPAAWALAPHEVADGPCKFVRQTNVPAMMRDGATLLADLYPDGRAINLNNGIIAAAQTASAGQR